MVTLTRAAYGAKEAAQLWSLSYATVRRLISRGKIRVVRVGTRTLIPASEIARIAEEGPR